MRRALLVSMATIASLLLPGSAFAMTSALTGSSNSDSVAALNSNSSSSSYGGANEANFLRIKNSNSPNPGFTSGTVDVNSDAVLVQAYVSNSSTSEAARNVSLTITLPAGFSTRQTIAATLRSDNAGTMSDSAVLVDSQPFGLQFDQGAQVYVAKRSGMGDNNYINQATGSYRINGNVMSVDLGDWVGGTNQQGLVTVRVLVTRGSVLPAFACTSLNRTSIDNNRSTFTAYSNGQAAQVNVSGYTFTVKDASGRVVDTFTNNTTAQNGVYNFNQTNSGTYTVTAIANSDKGATAITSNCTQSVTVPAVLSSTITTTATPASKALPNTGAGDIIGIFTGTSSLGAAGHFVYRRFRR